MDSPLEKNQDLKSVVLEETPWLRQAQAESQARRNVGVLFDENRLNEETARLLRKLSEQQTGRRRLALVPRRPALRLHHPLHRRRFRPAAAPGRQGRQRAGGESGGAVGRLDRPHLPPRSLTPSAKHATPGDTNKDESHLTPTIALYLYGRSFFLEDKPIAADHKEAVDYFLDQARKHWLKLACRQSQGQLALALKRFGDPTVPQEHHALDQGAIGERRGAGHVLAQHGALLVVVPGAQIETPGGDDRGANEVMNDTQAVEDCKVWLLKQKQTQDWKTTRRGQRGLRPALLGARQLASDELVEVTLGPTMIHPEKARPAPVSAKKARFLRREVAPNWARSPLKKTDPGVAWGSVHWQYLEDMSKVTAYNGTPLRLTKTLFTRHYTKRGPVLEPVAGPVKVGDELVVRVILRTDRDMDHVHLKDHRASGTEPVNVLVATTRYQDGLAYYQAPRNTASHFFIDYLPKGVYVFEYATRVVHKGEYQTGYSLDPVPLRPRVQQPLAEHPPSRPSNRTSHAPRDGNPDAPRRASNRSRPLE